MNAFQTKMSQQGFMEEFDDQDLLLRPQPKGRQDQQARPERFRRILAPVDLSERTVDALRCASAFADKADAVLEVLHVVHLSISDEEKGIPRSNLIRSLSEAAQRELQKIVALFLDGETITTLCVREGQPSEVILHEAAAAKSDLIIMSGRTRPLWARLLRPSVVECGLRRAACPVMVVPAGTDL